MSNSIPTIEDLAFNLELYAKGHPINPHILTESASLLRKAASGELVEAPIRCIDCEYSLPMDMKKYPDLTCHLCGGNLRVRVDMSCLCAKRPEKEDSHETD